MKRKSSGLDNPEVLEAVLQSIRSMTREEWLEMIAWRPEGYQDPEEEPDMTTESLSMADLGSASVSQVSIPLMMEET